MPTVDSPSVESNGRADIGPDDAILESLQGKIDTLEAQRAELQSALDEITPNLRRYEKAMTALRGESLSTSRTARVALDGEEGGEEAPERTRPGKRYPRSVGDERLAEIEAAVRRLAAAQDDFTQVDVRSATGHTSSMTATAFEMLRQRNVIRLVRRQGNLKIFRLTREALSADREPEA